MQGRCRHKIEPGTGRASLLLEAVQHGVFHMALAMTTHNKQQALLSLLRLAMLTSCSRGAGDCRCVPSIPRAQLTRSVITKTGISQPASIACLPVSATACVGVSLAISLRWLCPRRGQCIHGGFKLVSIQIL